MKRFLTTFFIGLTALTFGQDPSQKNIVFIVCDDLNRSGLGSIYNTEILAPHIDSLVNAGVAFTNAHSNAPLCGPSRASLFSGVAPTTSGHYGYKMGQNDWRMNPVLQNSTSVFRHFKENGYHSYAVGKLYHKKRRIDSDFTEYDERSKRGPYAYGNQTHTDLPIEFNTTGMTFAALENIPSTPEYTGWVNRDGSPFLVESSEVRDLLGDEHSVEYAKEIFANSQTSENPFFLTLGFRLPHHPMHIPQSFFDLYNIDDLSLDHLNDSIINSVAVLNNRYNSGSNSENYRLLMELVPEGESDPNYWIKRYVQAYYASISFLDEMIGQVCDALRENGLEGETYIVLTSDHGYHLGSKNMMAKTTLWNDASGVPIIISGPNISSQIVTQPVSLIDVYPTLIDLADLPNPESHELDGVSLLSVVQPGSENSTLISVASNQFLDVDVPGVDINQHHALVIGDYKYALYSSGEDELYNLVMDEHEVLDLSLHEDFQDIRKHLFQELRTRIGNTKTPQEKFNRLYYGDFEQDLNGWSPSVETTQFNLTVADAFFETQHLTIRQPSNISLENSNIDIDSAGLYTLKLSGYLDGIEAELECLLTIGSENIIDTVITMVQGPQIHKIEWQLYETPHTLGNQKLAIRLLSGNDLHIDDIQVIDETSFLESISNCTASSEISIDLGLAQIPAQDFSEAIFEKNTTCNGIGIPARSYWGSFAPSSSTGLLFALTSTGINPTMEVFENCTASSIRCGSFSGRRALLLLDELDTTTTYISRVTSTQMASEPMGLKIGFLNIYPAEVIPSSSDLTPSSNLEVSSFSLLNLSTDSVHFEFSSSGLTYPYTLSYSAANEYEMDLFPGLPFGTYIVKVSHQLETPRIKMPFGEDVQVTFAPDASFLRAFQNRSATVFPNPIRSGETLSLNISEESNLYSVTIRDMSGRVIHIALIKNQPQILFNIGNEWSSGMYIVELSDVNGDLESLLVRVL
ncbi:MAG: arylsulfatase A-like enzyme [Cryomorphaceae bacterium]|jgi:arylsulfatase A-like enzyme